MHKKYYPNILLIIVFLLAPLLIHAQQEFDSLLKNRQRAILIYNFAQQIGWDNIQNINSIKIGVLGNDPVVTEIKAISKKRKIHGKPIVIKQLASVADIKNISVLYVHERFNYDIHQILKKVSKKNILIISENYRFNASMINIIYSGESFHYELNSFNIKKQGFKISSNLLENAINSELKWQKLYIESGTSTSIKQKNILEKEDLKKKESKLEKQKTINNKQVEKIKFQKEVIIEQFENIDKKESKLEKLTTVKNEQNRQFLQKLKLLDSLEKYIVTQKNHLSLQKTTIETQKAYLKKQLTRIESQKNILLKQETVLSEQENELSVKKLQAFFAFVFAGFTGLIGFFIFRSNRLKKRLNKELVLKNIAIKQKTKILKIQNKEMEQFAYIASHDLQEPLNTIISFIQLINEDYKSRMDDIGKQSITYIGEASKRMKILITSLLEYSRLGRAHDFELVDCNVILLFLQKDLNELISRTNTELIIGQLPQIMANKVEIRLLFQNLISNGIKFMPKDRIPKIEISCKKGIHQINENSSKMSFKFSVKDNGIGIKKEHMSKIFAIFQRLHSPEEYKGTGIGLAHCKKIIESLGGQIGVTSKENEGSIFWFTLPINNEDEPNS